MFEVDDIFKEISEIPKTKRPRERRPLSKLIDDVAKELERKYNELKDKISDAPKEKRKVIKTLCEGFEFHMKYAKKDISMRYQSIQYALQILERLSEILDMPVDEFTKIYGEMQKIRRKQRLANATVTWDGSKLILRGRYYGREIHVMVFGKTPLSALKKLPDSTWGHAHKLVMKHVMPNIIDIAEKINSGSSEVRVL